MSNKVSNIKFGSIFALIVVPITIGVILLFVEYCCFQKNDPAELAPFSNINETPASAIDNPHSTIAPTLLMRTPEIIFEDNFEVIKADTYPSTTGWYNIYNLSSG